MNGTSHRHGKKTHSHPSSGRHRHVSAIHASQPVDGPRRHHAHELEHEHEHEHGHDHDHGQEQSHAGHTHGRVDPSILRSRAGVKAVALSFGVLAVTAVLEAVVFAVSGSVALLADLIHNGGDALTAIPLGVAFLLGSRRGERWAGYFVVSTIFVSASVAAYESIDRLIHPQHLDYLGALAVAGCIGFIGNEIAARVRLQAGHRLGSPALLADGAHARVDGFVSLGVVAVAVAVALGFPRADPIIGLAITAVILKVTWDAWRTVRAGDAPEGEIGGCWEHGHR
jgi:Co/Zn/Cd efflux system component